MNSYASCKFDDCLSKDTCIRYKYDSAVINFKFYYNEDKNKYDYYIEKQKDELKENK